MAMMSGSGACPALALQWGPMDEQPTADPRSWAAEPLRRALDAILYRWIALFGLAVVAAVAHVVGASREWVDTAVHMGLGAFLLGFIGLHLVGRVWRRHGSADGWRQARDADRGTVAVARTVGWVVLVGAAMALVSPLGTLADPKQFGMEILLWFPILFPLYCLAAWCTIDCARDRLGRAAEESRQRFRDYWRDLARQAGGSAA
jgi:hypothetical protein